MDTLWVPLAREVPIRAKRSKGAEWPLSGGEAEGTFLRELPQKRKNKIKISWETGSSTKASHVHFVRRACPDLDRPGASNRTHNWFQPGSQQGQASAPTYGRNRRFSRDGREATHARGTHGTNCGGTVLRRALQPLTTNV